MMNTKFCRRCNSEKLYSDFTKRSRSKDGLDTYCKSCNAQKSKNFNKVGDRRKQINKKYAKNNREKVLQDMRDWYSKNTMRVKNNVSKRIAEREKIDLLFKLTRILRSRLNCAINNNYKAGSAIRNLGCSIPELKKYLESQFQPGMSWDNRGIKGGWHIDHIKPLSSFDLSNPNELRKACHYTNLQPLWAKDNLAKRDKWQN